MLEIIRTSGKGLVAVSAAVFVLLASACSGDDGETAEPTRTATSAVTAVAEATGTPNATSPVAQTPSPVPETPTQPPAATATARPGSGLEALSLVYVDTRRGQGGDVYVAAADGSKADLVAGEPRFRRPLDVKGDTLAAVGDGGVLLIDLASGETRQLVESRVVFDGKFFDRETFLYSASGSCTQGGGALYRVDLPAYEITELFTSDFSLTVVGMDAGSERVALLPRGCDVGIGQIDIHDVETGELRNSYTLEGCGWAVALPDQNKAVTSWQSCTVPDEHAGASATVYDFGIVGPTGHDVTVPDGRPAASPWLVRPGHAEVALGIIRVEGTGPGSERGGGIYILDLATRQFRQVAAGQGAEQYPVAWSPDGRYLLYAIVAAQGLCSFSYVDIDSTAAEPVALNEQITFCGVNGHVVGWTELP